MATTEETTPAAETTQPQSNDAAPPPAAADATAAADDPAASTEAAAAPDDAKAAPEPTVIPRVVIVTGASSGLGLEVSHTLCAAGHDVIMACRNEEKTNRAIEKLKRQNLNGSLTYMHLDLADLESVRKFVDDFRATDKKLSVLINNAGLALGFKDNKRQFTKENFELTMGTNHIGHFVLTYLLLDDLKKSAAAEDGDARVVVVSSGMHDIECSKKRGPVQPLDLDNLFLFNDGTYSGLQAYKNSKLANVLFAYQLSRHLDGTGIKVNAVDPGFVPSTDLLRSASGAHKFYTRYILHGMLRFTKQTRSVSQAGAAISTVATGDKFKDTTGKYIRDGVEVRSSEESLDEEKQKKLWEMTGGYARLDGFAPLEVPPPPAEPAPEEPKTEPKAEEANGEAAKETGDTPVIIDSNNPEEIKTEEKGAGDKEEQHEGEKNEADESKPEAADKVDGN